MTRVFVYEHLTGGGLLETDIRANDSLLREGTAMATAVVADLAKIPGVETAVLRDARLKQVAFAGRETVDVDTEASRRDCYRRLAAQCDWTLVIAPECDGVLYSLAEEVESVGGRLLGPGSAAIHRLGDKQATCEWLNSAAIATPEGLPLAANEPLPGEFRYPAVLKPRDGVGSCDVRLVERRSAASIRLGRPSRLEAFCPGTAVSVALLAGPQQWLTLPPTHQRLSDDGRFRYLGGSLPIPRGLAKRARQLAGRVARHLCAAPSNQTRGYLGIDMVLGDDPHGAGDVVIEVNPRLTTSYIGLRAATSDNLAEVMLKLAIGKRVTLGARFRNVEFAA